MELAITSFCRIKKDAMIVNGKYFNFPKSDNPSYFFAEAYKQLNLNYPKFHKMDNLSKLGLLATEAAIQNTGVLERNDVSKAAIVLSNRASSLDTDRIHQKSISDPSSYLPSPSVFVYTLPNIVIGEIAIKYKITGENAFFVTDAFNADLLYNYAKNLFNQGAAASAICGWADIDNGNYEALIYLVEIVNDSIKNTNFKVLNQPNINQLYRQ
jgi:3-oxoacyl-(acyl-carrier-protein) synthase